MLVRDSQHKKALFPIVVILLGIFMLVRDSQLAKIQAPIVLTLFGIFMLLRDLQPAYLLLVDYQYYTL